MKWMVSNCESVGNMHDVCQDQTAVFQNETITVTALADGLSSKCFSDVGAKIATETACRELAEHFPEYYSGERTAQDFVAAIQEAVLEQSSSEMAYDEMKCTLLVCAVFENQFLLGHIGDGAILFFGKDSRVIAQPQSNEVGGSATYTILDYDAETHFEFMRGELNDCDGFLLTSDGLMGNVYYDGTELPQFAYTLFRSIYGFKSDTPKEERDRQYREYLHEFIQKDNEFADDCSIVIVARETLTGLVDYEAENGFAPDVTWPCLCGHINEMDEIRCSNLDCRMLYISVYRDEVVDIKSKESFFSKLNQWLNGTERTRFEPGISADIVSQGRFDALCHKLWRVNHPDMEQSAGPEAPSEELSKPDVMSSLLQTGKELFDHGIHRLNHTVQQKYWPKVPELKTDSCKDRIVLYKDEILELTEQLGLNKASLSPAPMDIQPEDKKMQVVEILFRADARVEIVESTKDHSWSVYLYKKDHRYSSAECMDKNRMEFCFFHSTQETEEFINHLKHVLNIRLDTQSMIRDMRLKKSGETCYLHWNWKKELDDSMSDPQSIFERAIYEFIQSDSRGKYSQLRKISRMVSMVGTTGKRKRLCAFIWTEDGPFMLTARDGHTFALEGVRMRDMSLRFSRFLEGILFADQNEIGRIR